MYDYYSEVNDFYFEVNVSSQTYFRPVVLTEPLLLGIHATTFLRFYFFTLNFHLHPSFFLLWMSTYRRTQQINTLSVSMHSKSVVPLLDIHRCPALMDWLPTDSISLCARLCAFDILTPQQWRAQLLGPRRVGFREKLSGLALTHVSVLAAAYRKSCCTVTSAPELTTEDISAFSHMRVKSPSCDTNTQSSLSALSVITCNFESLDFALYQTVFSTFGGHSLTPILIWILKQVFCCIGLQIQHSMKPLDWHPAGRTFI